MTELDVVRHGPGVDDGYLVRWADNARAAAGIAKSLARTPFVPSTLRDRDTDTTVGNITAAILTGTELGLTPMAALRSIDVIQGTPTLRAVALRALVLSAGHELIVDESTATRAIVRGRRRGSDEWQRSVWTIDRARQYGVAGNDNWRKQPTAMLIARATAECARLIAADVLLAIPYVAEEMQDGGADSDGAAPEPATRTPARRTAQRKPRAATAPPPAPPPADEPPHDHNPADDTRGIIDMPLPDPDEPATDDEDVFARPITAPHQKLLHATLRDLGITERDAELELISKILDGREITTTKTLTVADATAVIDELRRMQLRLGEPDDHA